MKQHLVIMGKEKNTYEFDLSMIVGLFSDDYDALQKIKNDIVNHAQLTITELHKKLETGDFDSLKHVAHRFKSTIQVFGESKLLQLVDRIEKECSTLGIDQLTALIKEAETLVSVLILQLEDRIK